MLQSVVRWLLMFRDDDIYGGDDEDEQQAELPGTALPDDVLKLYPFLQEKEREVLTDILRDESLRELICSWRSVGRQRTSPLGEKYCDGGINLAIGPEYIAEALKRHHASASSESESGKVALHLTVCCYEDRSRPDICYKLA